MSNDDITLEELLHAVLGFADEEATQEPPGRMVECVSLRKLEAHAKKQRFLSDDEMRHVNRCPDHCQPNLDALREHYGPQVAVFSAESVQRLAAHEERGGPTVYSAVFETDRGDVLGPADVVVTDGPFWTNGRYLVFRLVITGAMFQPEMLPLRLSMTDIKHPGSPVFTFDLPTPANEIVKIKIPQDLACEERWKEVEKTGNLPLAFVLQATGSSNLTAI